MIHLRRTGTVFHTKGVRKSMKEKEDNPQHLSMPQLVTVATWLGVLLSFSSSPGSSTALLYHYFQPFLKEGRGVGSVRGWVGM